MIPAIITTFDSHRWSPGCFQPGPFVRQIVRLFCCSVAFRKVPRFLLSVNKEGSLQGAYHTTTQAWMLPPHGNQHPGSNRLFAQCHLLKLTSQQSWDPMLSRGIRDTPGCQQRGYIWHQGPENHINTILDLYTLFLSHSHMLSFLDKNFAFMHQNIVIHKIVIFIYLDFSPYITCL